MDEHLKHTLLKCSHAKRLWDEAQQLFDFHMARLHPSTWAKDIACDDRFTGKERSIMVSITWSIWLPVKKKCHSRNRLKHEEEGLDLAASVHLVRVALTLLDIPRHHALEMPGHGWRPRVPNYAKISTHTAIKREDGRGGAGGVAQSSSSFLGVWRKLYPGVTDPLIVEAMAV